ncbi:MAG TPA: hypothetical protein VGM19_00710 [Armatimonadota bacterium]|jgi:hypothetical protein
MSDVLSFWPVAHAGLTPVFHPRLGVEINGQSAVRYLRFLRPVELDHLELPLLPRAGRWVPEVPSHPAHLLISVWEDGAWRLVREVSLPLDPRLAGEGLCEDLPVAEMDAHFARVLADPPHRIDLGGLRTDHLRVECDREHPVWPNHGECNGGEYHVPFALLNPLTAHGRALQEDFYPPTYRPLLQTGAVEPVAPTGMTVTPRPDMLLFSGDRLSVGFSLRRPTLTHLGWDAHDQGLAGRQRLAFAKRPGWVEAAGGPSGPLLRTLTADLGAHLWTGAVEVRGNQVAYRGLHAAEGLTLDAVFTVEPDRLRLELTQTCAAALPALQAEAWRLLFDLRQGVTACAGLPTLRPGRNGEVALPAWWASDSVGCLGMDLLEHDGPAPRVQVESYRDLPAVSGGIVLAAEQSPQGTTVLPAGTQRAVVELAVTALEPAGLPGRALSVGAASRWAAIFSCFRPEYGGFSNNAASVNCHLSQGAPLDLVACTRPPEHGPDPVALGRFTLERALLDGGGYGYFRNLYLDSDPNLVCAAGRLHQVRPDLAWLQRIAPGLREATDRMLGTLGAEGLAVCRDLSGDTGSYRWSSNGMDVVGFGHLDAYVNAWTYRALRNAAALWRDLGEADPAARCGAAADRLRAAYAPALVNPATGWVAGWRSRDGELHDYAFLWVNGPALAWGLLDDEAARTALRNLEALRARVGPGSMALGPPVNLLPIDPGDHMLPLLLPRTGPTFENYTDGALCPQAVTYYLRALARYGLRAEAARLAAELEEGYAAGIFDGGMGTGHEFRSWEGLPTGYEGTLIGCFAPLYALAIEQGVIEPPDPEWWPA